VDWIDKGRYNLFLMVRVLIDRVFVLAHTSFLDHFPDPLFATTAPNFVKIKKSKQNNTITTTNQ
jgi:hypothetical protein